MVSQDNYVGICNLRCNTPLNQTLKDYQAFLIPPLATPATPSTHRKVVGKQRGFVLILNPTFSGGLQQQCGDEGAPGRWSRVQLIQRKRKPGQKAYAMLS